jgi:uncharacterized protein YuzE
MSRAEHQLLVRSEKPPVVEFDPAAGAVYVKFSARRVFKTLERSSDGPIVTVDLDRDGQVVGIEGICFDEFTIQKLLRVARVSAEGIDFSKAKLRATSRHVKEQIPA